MPFVIWVAFRYGRRNRPATQEVQQRIAELTAEAEENVSGVRVVKAFAQEERQLRRFRHAVRRVFDQSMVSTRLRAFYSPFIGFLPQLGLAALLLVGGRQAINGQITVGEFVAFYGYVLMLTGRRCGCSASRSGWPSARWRPAQRVFEILDREPRLTSAPGAPAAAAAAAGASSCATSPSPTRAASRCCATSTCQSRPGQTRRARRADRLGQDDARDADPAPVRRDGRGGAGGRRGRAGRRPRVAAARDRAGLGRRVPLLRQPARQHRLRAPGGHRRRGRRSGRARRAERVGRRPARGLRHARRRARAHPERRPAPAGRDRARAAGRAAHPDPRRRDLERGRHHREPHQGGARGGHGGTDHLRDRPPALHHRPRRRDRGARGRARLPRAARTTSCSRSPSSTARSPRRACPTRCSSRARIPSARWRGCEAAHHANAAPRCALLAALPRRRSSSCSSR